MKYDYSFLYKYLSWFIDDSINDKSEYIDNYINEIPSKLYRYRTGKEYDIKSFKNNYVYLTSPDSFDDIEDSIIRFDFEKQKEEITTLMINNLGRIIVEELEKKFVERKIKFDNKFFKEWLIKYSLDNTINMEDGDPFREVRKRILQSNLASSEGLAYVKRINDITNDEYIKKQSDKLFEYLIELKQKIKSESRVCCFTSDVTNKKFWEEYADKYKGFCIEYDFSRITNQKLKYLLAPLSPIIYDRESSVNFVKLLDIAFRKQQGLNVSKEEIKDFYIELNVQMRTKNHGYEKESEWRILVEKGVNIPNEYDFPFAKAIYLGHKMELDKKNELIKIAKEKKIDIYEQYINPIKSTLDYRILSDR